MDLATPMSHGRPGDNRRPPFADNASDFWMPHVQKGGA
jgi:hypothetical protein